METTIRNHQYDAPAREHNERDADLVKHEPHIDTVNGIHEIWGTDRGLREAYQDIFGDAIEDYNAKQTRDDRKLDVDKYMQSVEDDTRGRRKTKMKGGQRVIDESSKKGKKLSYERIISVGNVEDKMRESDGKIMYDDNGHEVHPHAVPYEVNYAVCKRYYETFEERNPHMKVVRCDWHADEFYTNALGVKEWATEHAHMEFIPVATGYQRGLSMQNAMGKALAQQGFKDGYFDEAGQPCAKDTAGAKWRCAYDAWNESENACMEAILQEEYAKYCAAHPGYAAEHGADVVILHPDAKKGIESISPEEYRQKKALESELEGLAEGVEDAYDTIAYATEFKKRTEREALDQQAQWQVKTDDQNRYVSALAGSYHYAIEKLESAAAAYKGAAMQTRKKDAYDDVMDFMASHTIRRKGKDGQPESITLKAWYEQDKARRQAQEQAQLMQQEAAARQAAQRAVSSHKEPASMRERRAQLSKELEQYEQNKRQAQDWQLGD